MAVALALVAWAASASASAVDSVGGAVTTGVTAAVGGSRATFGPVEAAAAVDGLGG